MEYEQLRYRVEAPIAWVELHRPAKLNAITAVMLGELGEALGRADGDGEVRAVVLCGAGRAFSAGYDLGEGAGAGRSAAAWREELQHDLEGELAVWEARKPVVCAVHGWCLGGALELALLSDLTLVAADAKLGAPEVRGGSGPAALILPWLAGMKKARELLYTGEWVDAQEAVRIGLANRVVEGDRLLYEAGRLGRRLALVPATTMELTKAQLNASYETAGLRRALLEALERGAELNAAGSPEQEEFDRIARDQGVKAAVAWRERRWAEQDQGGRAGAQQ